MTAPAETAGPVGARGRPLPALARLFAFARARRPGTLRLARAIRDRKLTYADRKKFNRIAEAMAVASQAAAGSYIEAGVALGGTAIFIARLKPKDSALHLYDVFAMIPPPGAADGADVHERYAVIRGGQSQGIGGDVYYGYLDNLYDLVLHNLRLFGVDPQAERVTLHKGTFEETLFPDSAVRFAHIDCDWHDPVLTCIERIWPRLAPGGVMLFDDYHAYSGCRHAVDAFLDGNRDAEILFNEPSIAVRRIAV